MFQSWYNLYQSLESAVNGLHPATSFGIVAIASLLTCLILRHQK